MQKYVQPHNSPNQQMLGIVLHRLKTYNKMLWPINKYIKIIFQEHSQNINVSFTTVM